MNRYLKALTFGLAIVLMAACQVQAASYYATHATLAAVNIGPSGGQRDLTFVSATATNVGAYVELLAGGSTTYKVATAQSSAVTNVIFNSVTGLAVNDKLLVVHADGTVDYRTVAGVTALTKQVDLNAAPSKALTTGGRIWEISTAGRYTLPFIYDGTTNAVKVTLPLLLNGSIFRAYGVPIRLELTATNGSLSVTTTD
jgi:biopolymer transport protein ExbD